MGTGDLEIVRMVIPSFAHMGGIDEIGIFVIPALLAIYVLRRTEREARKRAADGSEAGEPAHPSVERVSDPEPPLPSDLASGVWRLRGCAPRQTDRRHLASPH